MGDRFVVVGFGRSGEAAARHLLGEGAEVVAVDDRPDDDLRQRASELGVRLVEAPGPSELADLVRSADLVVASPGVPARHPVMALGATVVSELELAWRSASVPIVAVTGTNGKTTVTTLVTSMLEASGLRAAATGNIGTPLVEAVRGDAEVLVVEASSFQLALTSRFAPSVAVWLNVSEDHLDWHPAMGHYVAAKARIWANQAPDDVAVANAEDAVVADEAHRAPGRVVSFGIATGDYRVEHGAIVTPLGDVVVELDQLQRSFPHDRANVAAASAAALAAGASLQGCRDAAVAFEGLPHRLQLVGEAEGVRFYDDSKATTPASVLAALAGFDSVVLIAGGRNKGLDLGGLADGSQHIRAVVATGEAAGDVERAFAGLRPVQRAASMGEAVTMAAGAARPGDAVLLSPGCASFDWYRSYAERGVAFSEAVAKLARGAGR